MTEDKMNKVIQDITLALEYAKEMLDQMNQDDRILGRVDRQQQILLADLFLREMK